jgi:regulator of protease activity HflC (stomatin/prohibitin superfamily)
MFELLLGAMAGLGMSLITGVRVLREYERAVVFRLGRARGNLAGPGLVLLLPFGIDRAKVVDTRIQAIQIPPQEVITRDNISIVVSAVVYANVSSPRHAVLEVDQYLPATL